jgi:hypothetical protein
VHCVHVRFNGKYRLRPLPSVWCVCVGHGWSLPVHRVRASLLILIVILILILYILLCSFPHFILLTLLLFSQLLLLLSRLSIYASNLPAHSYLICRRGQLFAILFCDIVLYFLFPCTVKSIYPLLPSPLVSSSLPARTQLYSTLP